MNEKAFNEDENLTINEIVKIIASSVNKYIPSIVIENNFSEMN